MLTTLLRISSIILSICSKFEEALTLQNRKYMYVKFWLQRPRKSSATILSITHESQCTYKERDTAVFSVYVLRITVHAFSKHFPGRWVYRKLQWSVRVKRCNVLAFIGLMIYRAAYSAQLSYTLNVYRIHCLQRWPALLCCPRSNYCHYFLSANL